jgi:ABC-2 type transport system permease protein
MTALRASIALGNRELIRITRQPSRIIASIATPLLIWTFIAAGFSRAIADQSGSSFTAAMIPGIASLTVMFSSIFASISLIQDRHEGFLRAALLSPTPRLWIVLAKVWSGTLIALVQGLIILALLPVLGVPLTLPGTLGAIAALVCVSVSLIGLGLALAWIVDSSQGFHGVMNAVLMPLWITSGAVFPVTEAAPWLKAIAYANPLTWIHDAMRRSLDLPAIDSAPTWLPWTVSISVAALMVVFATLVMSANSKRP